MGFFLPVPPAAGGATEKLWHRLAGEFAAQGHQVTILSRQWAGWPADEQRNGVRHLRLAGFDHTSRLRTNLWRDFRWSFRVARALPPADITVVNAVSLPLLLPFIRRRAGKIALMTGRIPKGQYRWYPEPDYVLAVSSTLRAAVLAENPRLAEKIKVMGCPIDCGRLGAGEPRRAGPPVTLGFVGRIHREKGLDLLVAALALLARKNGLPPWRAVIRGPIAVGQGGSGETYAEALRRSLAAALAPDQFEIGGPTFDDAELADIYRRIDVFCYPSVAAQGETFGVAVAEAMAAGAVPVVSQLECFSDLVRPGENGVTFDHEAADAAAGLADVLARLVADAALRVRLATAARTSVQRFDVPVYARTLLADFSALQ